MAAQQPILIGEDMAPFQALQQAAKEAFRRIETVKQAYEVLNIGTFDQEVYTAVISGKIEEIRQRYTEEARQAVERLNIPNPQIRQNMLAGTGELFTTFQEAADNLKQCTYNPTSISGSRPLPLEVISIIEGAPTITEEAIQNFKEAYCRTYVATPQEHLAYQKFKELEEAAAGFYTMLKEAGVRTSTYDFSELNQLLTKSEEGKVGFKPDVVKWVGSKLQ